MAMKSMLLVTLLVVVFTAPQATQGVKMAIRGTVYCSADGNMVVSALTGATPPYANALVQVSCLGNVVSLATTNSNGAFQVDADLPLNVTMVLSQCGMAVVTPVMIGDPSQPTLGYLQSRLQWHKTTTRENQDVAEFSPLGFKLNKMIGDPSQPTLGYLQSILQWHKTTTRENQDVAEFSPLGFKFQIDQNVMIYFQHRLKLGTK